MPNDRDQNLGIMVEHLQQKTRLLQDRVTLLEEENKEFAELLKKHGVDVRLKAMAAMEVPPPLTEPAEDLAETLVTMSKPVRRLYDRECGKDDTILLLLTGSVADVGRFFRKSRVWLCITRSEVILLAAGRQPLVQRIPFPHIQQSLYNHITAELVLAPNRKFTLPNVKVSPVQGYQVLAQIYTAKPS